MLRRLAVASIVFTAACASQQKPAPGPAAPVEKGMRITNQSPFDVAVCDSRPLELPQPANQGILIGAHVSVRPQMMECLVNPKHRGKESTTKLVVKTSLNDQGGTHAVTGENLTPEGQQCVQKLVDARVPLVALPKGSQPVEAQTELVHEVGNSPSVTFGINEGSDYSGNVRLSQQQWCECYAGFADKAPPVLKANVQLVKTQQTAADITFDPAGTPEGEQLATCLKQKMMAVSAQIASDQVKFPHRFVHFHSRATEPSPDLAPELRFFQLELVRGQRAADAAIHFGARANAASVYDAVVVKYQKTKDWKLGPQLKEKCKDLVSAAQLWVNAVEAQKQVDEQTLANVQELKAKDPAWADVEAKSQETLSRTQQELAAAQQRLKDDQNICPKEKY